MRKYLLLIITAFLFFACNTEKREANLPNTFLESLSKGNFDLLKSYLPTVEFYKSLGSSAPERSDSDIVKFIDRSNERLKENWEKIRGRLQSANVNADDIDIKETIVYSPFKEKRIQWMVAVYDYKNKRADDMLFSISEWNGKIFLLEIPNSESFLSMEDTSLRNSSEAKLSIEMNKPEFKRSVQDKVEKLISYAKENKVKEFTGSIVYRGEDEARRWKTAMSMNDTAEAQRVKEFIDEVNFYIQNCPDRTFGEIRTESESEGTWIIMPVSCSTSIVYFAFLKINGDLLLGDIDIEMRE
jgi:hypothetical protein